MRKNLLVLWTVVVISLLTFAGFPTAWAETFTTGALVQVSDTSPFADCTVDDIENQPGENISGSEVEPWVDVNPVNPKNIVGAWQQDRWSNRGARGLVAGVSFDRGATWQKVVIPKISLCSGGTAENGGDFQRVSDPWLSFAPNGDLYYMSLGWNLNGTGGMLVSKSIDGGLTWSDPITLIRSEDPRLFNDKNAITADPTDANFVYAVWDQVNLQSDTAPTMFTRTTNGGQTWEAPHVIYDPGVGNSTLANQIVVLPNGALVNFFMEFLHGAGQPEINLALIRSADRGVTWGKANRAAQMQLVDVRDPETGAPMRTGSLLEVAVDRTTGRLYVVWEDARFSDFQHNSIAFTQSIDGGFTWSPPIKINQTPTTIASSNQQAFTPSVHVATDGTIGVTYYDFRNNTRKPSLKTDYFIVHCHPTTPETCAKAENWEGEVRLTDKSFDLTGAPFAGGFFVGDYQGLASADNDFIAFFSQSHNSDPASVFFRRVRDRKP
jgi:hypothetical protein